MTVSTLLEIETCPRRWALASADYPEIWAGHGYPPKPQISGLAGSAVHLALETVTKALVHAGCTSVRDAGAVRLMKSLGGYSKVLEDCVDRIVERFVGNPRAAHLLENSGSSLRTQIPELRTRAQVLLGRLRLLGRKAIADRPSEAKTRGPLLHGAFSEIELRVPRLRWKGRVDLLILSDDECEILDFKTGTENDQHLFQVSVYALLWGQDVELNPTGRLASRLRLAYRAGDVIVTPPSAAELTVLENEIVTRQEAAERAVAKKPPDAYPSADNCHSCNVRQLCDAYWGPETQEQLAMIADENQFSDVELRVIGRHGPSSWDGVIEFFCGKPGVVGKRCVLRASQQGLDCQTGMRLRILHARITPTIDGASQPPVITLGVNSEVYVVGW
ncbi:MAG: PD-(D/E)XK nuclease family protein [Candidatus Omnitrophica bacterium]|nr:PD-(D/E)XK nuclease family protein [Candidatus Omnitrophota bacterium]